MCLARAEILYLKVYQVLKRWIMKWVLQNGDGCYGCYQILEDLELLRREFLFSFFIVLKLCSMLVVIIDDYWWVKHAQKVTKSYCNWLLWHWKPFTRHYFKISPFFWAAQCHLVVVKSHWWSKWLRVLSIVEKLSLLGNHHFWLFI